MKKNVVFLLLIPLFLAFFSLSFFGEEENDWMVQVEEQVGYSAFYDAIPQETIAFWESYGLDLSEDSPAPTWETVITMAVSMFFSILSEYFPLFSVGIALLVLFRVLQGLCKSHEGLLESVGYLAVISNGAYSFSVMEALLSSLAEVSQQSSS
ncbi:MAG: hypothetical protein II348_04625, partial [Clostridia bacterium]|nr:hypothetical protein [Clostridia bacterium]